MAEGFVPVNETEEAMADAHAGGLSMSAFMAKLLESPVFLEAPGEAEDGYELAARRGEDGALFVPAFTSVDRLERFGDTGGTAVSLKEMAEVWPEDVALVVNPGDPVELVVTGDDLRRAAQIPATDRHARVAMPAGTSVLVGDPADEPVAVLEAVGSACSNVPAVVEAYRAQIHFQRPGEQPHLAIALELDQPAAAEHAERKIAAAATGAGAGAVSVFVVDETGEAGTIADRVREGRTPFYRRGHELLAAMEAATEGGDAPVRAAIHDVFRDAVVIVPISDAQVADEPEVRAVRREDGRLSVLAFTDAGALRNWTSDPVRWATVYGRSLASLAVERDVYSVALNPAGPYGGELITSELKALAESDGFDIRAVDPASGMASMSVRADAGYELQPSADFPSDLIEVARRALQGRTDVLRAYALEGKTEKVPRWYTVGVQLAPGAEGSAVAAAMGTRLPSGRRLDVLPLDPGLHESLAGKIDPFWVSEAA